MPKKTKRNGIFRQKKNKSMKARHIIIMWIAAAMIIVAALPSFALSVYDQPVKTESHDRLTDNSKKQHDRPAAVINETTSSLQLCMPRSQRLLPSFGFHPSKTHARTNYIHTTPVYNLCQNSTLRQEPAGFVSSVSRLYYVIALRHLIC